MNIQRSIGLFLAGTCTVAGAGPAFAQAAKAQAANAQAANAQPQPNQAPADQNAIIITAEKRPQLLLDVPQSVTAVSGGTLEAQHATNHQ